MKALLSLAAGGPETLELSEEAEPPQPGSEEIVLRVKACAVNYPDVLIIEAKCQIKPPRPFAPGSEVSGVVETIGASVRDFKPGDRVIAYIGWGGMMEKILVAAKRCTPIPDSVPFEEASSLITTYGTTYHALRDRAKLQPGERLVVLGAAGGVGLAAIQLGKTMGATVIVAASTEEKVLKAKEHGGDIGFVYPPGNLDKDRARFMTESLKQLAGPEGMDVIYDPVGGDYTEAALRAIGWQGRYLVVGFTAGIPKPPLNLALLKSCQIIGVYWGEFINRLPSQHAANVAALMALYREGRIKPAISERFPLQRAGEAIGRLGTREVRGKVVVMVE